MNRKTRVMRCSVVMGILLLGLTLGMVCKKKNQPPNAPSIPSGPASGRKGDTLRFSTVAEDPDGDSVAARFDWGDSTISDWSALVPNGDSVAVTHAWQRLAMYSIRAQARDVGETASVWSGGHQLAIASFSVAFGGSGAFEGNSVLQTSDGGYVIVGSCGAGAQDVWLVKTDASGNKVWDKTFGGANDDVGYSVQQISDGGYIIAGYTYSYGAGRADVWLVKTDASGNKVWDKTFGGSRNDGALSVHQTSDGGYIMAGYADNLYKAWLIKTDADGNEVWARVFGGSDYIDYSSVQQTSDGGFICVGSAYSSPSVGYDVLLVKTGADGNTVWSKLFVGEGDDFGNSVRQTSDGGYIVTGGTESYGAGGRDVWLIKTDASGDKVWDKTFGGAYDDEGYSVLQTSDGGYIIAGSVIPFGASCEDVWLIKTDGSGNEVWERTFGGTESDWGNSVQQTSDGGYIITGYTEDDGRGGYGAWLIKTDAEGN